MTGHQ